MTAGEVYSEVSAHIIEGVMVHDELARYYDFLAIPCYKEMHERHAKEEFCNYHRLNEHFMSVHNRLVPDKSVGRNKEIIPESWYRYSRDEVDVATKKTGIKNGMNAWVNWENSTKEFLKEMLAELTDREDRSFIMKLLDDAIEEEKCAHDKMLKLKAVDYSLEYILK